MKITKVKIRVTPNVGNVPINRETQLPAPFGGCFRSNFPWAETNPQIVFFFSIFLGGPLDPIHLV